MAADAELRDKSGPSIGVGVSETSGGVSAPGLGAWGWGLLLLLTAIGAVLRFWRLGDLGFIVDEGYQSTAVAAILERGVPVMDTGYAYVRSALFLYLQAGCAWLLGFNEWSLRFPAVVLGVLGVPLAYWFGRSIFNVRVGLVLAALMAVSAWEVEYARYARFYTLFQGLYVVGLVAWYRGFIQMRPGWRWAFAGVFVLAVITHELGVMLGLSFLMILPLRGYSLRRKAAYFGLSALCGMVWRGLQGAQDRMQLAVGTATGWGQADAARAAQTAPPAERGPIPWPEFETVRTAWETQAVGLIVGGVLAVGVAGLVGWCITQTSEARLPAGAMIHGGGRGGTAGRKAVRGLLLIGIIGAAALNLLALAMVLGVAYLALFVRRGRQLRRPEVLLTLGAVILATGGWIVWHRVSPRSSLTSGLASMLSDPNLYDYFFKWMVYGWPATLVLVALGFVPLMRRAIERRTRQNPTPPTFPFREQNRRPRQTPPR